MLNLCLPVNNCLRFEKSIKIVLTDRSADKSSPAGETLTFKKMSYAKISKFSRIESQEKKGS
jgi:hypothetical protein